MRSVHRQAVEMRPADGRDLTRLLALAESAYRGVSSRLGWATGAEVAHVGLGEFQTVRSDA
jgi:hypothetical protein